MPEACCRREPQSRDGVLLSREECLLGRELFLNKQVPGPALSRQGEPVPHGLGGQSQGGGGGGAGSVSPEGLKALGESDGSVGYGMGLLNWGW